MFNKKTKNINRIGCILFFFFFHLTYTRAQVKITDTVYYNKIWKICEKPIAAYYRVAVLAALNDVWYYTGKVMDYTIDGVPLMEGEYSGDGNRDGDYQFYFPNGKVQAKGKYLKTKMVGDWYWYYPDGKEKGIINFPDDMQQFQFLKYIDVNGQITLDKGTGNFSWYSNPFDTLHSTFIFTGSFVEGKRSGDWLFGGNKELGNSMAGFTERYDEKGTFTKVVKDGFTYKNMKSHIFDFSPDVFRNTEALEYDDLFKINGDSSAINNLIYYLIEHKPAEINFENVLFDTAFATIIRTLDKFKFYIKLIESKDIDTKLEFSIGPKGDLGNIKFSGYGMDSLEKKIFTFLLGKFKNIRIPKDLNKTTPVNFTIYFSSFNVVRSMNGDSMTTKTIFVSFLPREKMLKLNPDEIRQTKIDGINYHHYLEN